MWICRILLECIQLLKWGCSAHFLFQWTALGRRICCWTQWQKQTTMMKLIGPWGMKVDGMLFITPRSRVHRGNYIPRVPGNVPHDIIEPPKYQGYNSAQSCCNTAPPECHSKRNNGLFCTTGKPMGSSEAAALPATIIEVVESKLKGSKKSVEKFWKLTMGLKLDYGLVKTGNRYHVEHDSFDIEVLICRLRKLSDPMKPENAKDLVGGSVLMELVTKSTKEGFREAARAVGSFCDQLSPYAEFIKAAWILFLCKVVVSIYWSSLRLGSITFFTSDIVDP